MKNTLPDPDREALAQAIIDSPGEDGPRLAFADWQEEHGNVARAELIRVQCELPRLGRKETTRRNQLRAREKELLQSPHLKADLPRVRGLKYERGFIRNFPVMSDGLAAEEGGPSEELPGAPLDRVLTLILSFNAGACPTEAYLGGLADRWWLARVVELQFYAGGPMPEGLRLLAGSPGLLNLETITFQEGYIPSETIANLVLAPAIRRLRNLHLEGHFTLAGHPDKIGVIESRNHPVVNSAVRKIVSSPKIASLQRLQVCVRGLGEEGVRAILESPHLEGLKKLELGNYRSLSAELRRGLSDRFGPMDSLGCFTRDDYEE
jgi:uncharacterized protein (TIGR02996 family)